VQRIAQPIHLMVGDASYPTRAAIHRSALLLPEAEDRAGCRSPFNRCVTTHKEGGEVGIGVEGKWLSVALDSL
jgi:hypothetical protein